MSAQQKSLLLLEKQGSFAVQNTDIPKPGPGELLVEIHATALNPVDWKIQVYGYFIQDFPAVLGTDAAGVVKELGEGVTSFAIGDKVYVYFNPNLNLLSRLTHNVYTAFTRDTLPTAAPHSSNTRSCLLRLSQRLVSNSACY